MKHSEPTSRRLKPEERTELLLGVALKLAGKHGLSRITREQIAEAAEVSPALVSARLGTMAALRRSVMRLAVTRGNVALIAQGIAMRDPHALKASPELRAKAAAHLMRA